MSDGRIVSRQDLAEMLAVDLRTVDAWLRRGCPIVTRGGRGRAHEFDSARVVEWLLERARTRSSKVVSLDEARQRKTAAEAELAELELNHVRHSVAPIDMVAEILEAVASSVRRRLESVPGELADRVAASRSAATIRRLLEDEFSAVLATLSGGDPIFEVIRCKAN